MGIPLRTNCIMIIILAITCKIGTLYLSHIQAVQVQASLRICAVPQDPLLLAWAKYGSRGRLKPTIKPLPDLDRSARVFEGGLSAYAINIEISCAGSIIVFA